MSEQIEYEGVVYHTGHWPLVGQKVKIPQHRIDGKIVGYSGETGNVLIQQGLSDRYIIASMRFLEQYGYE